MSLDWVMLNLETLLNLEKKFKVQQLFLDHQMRHFEIYPTICCLQHSDEYWILQLKKSLTHENGVQKKNQKVFTRFVII
jgi:hypothetical protein